MARKRFQSHLTALPQANARELKAHWKPSPACAKLTGMVNEIKPSVERVVAKSAEKKAWRKPSVQRIDLRVTGLNVVGGADAAAGDDATFS